MTKDLILGGSPAFSAAVETVDAYSVSAWPVLLLGETGVGKELLARRVHQQSRRRLSPFIPINCGAMPASLFESELFGHEKGAFSGADQYSKGLLRQAAGGTLFLDEVGDLELNLQVKLLRFLDTGEVRAVGSTRIERVDVRLVTATNVNLYAAVRTGRFRHDLLERLSVLTVRVPPLRDRRADIVPLAETFLKELGCRCASSELAPLSGYEWPGNVRQLRNCLVRVSVRARGEVTRETIESVLAEETALASDMRQPVDDGSDLLTGSLAEIEKQVIVARLKNCQGNRRKAAEELGIAKSTLQEKLRRWKDEDAGAAHWPLVGRSAGGGALSL